MASFPATFVAGVPEAATTPGAPPSTPIVACDRFNDLGLLRGLARGLHNREVVGCDATVSFWEPKRSCSFSLRSRACVFSSCSTRARSRSRAALEALGGAASTAGGEGPAESTAAGGGSADWPALNGTAEPERVRPRRTQARSSSKSARASRGARASSSQLIRSRVLLVRSASCCARSASSLRRFTSARARSSFDTSSSRCFPKYRKLRLRSSGKVVATAASASYSRAQAVPFGIAEPQNYSIRAEGQQSR
mmetsp:Transcript_23643/g.52427  ORF Transcript_23643/g.52427 Transcript_23643/m.52427 type:complete len:251 (+) Transcript_23643:756-1508(+)